MHLYAGTSGFAYEEWRGSFYPGGLPAAEMLRAYATKLPAVEINNTFYRMPRTSVVESWRAQVPDAFRFSIKASQRITHIKRLGDCGDEVAWLLRQLDPLGETLGAVLFQLPPDLEADVPRLEAFLALLPDGLKAAFEFRHESWRAEPVLALLRARNFALVGGDEEDGESSIVTTGDWGYLRFRLEEYDAAQVAARARVVAAQPWTHAFAFFKHEIDGAPELAAQFLKAPAAAAPARKQARSTARVQRAPRRTG